MIHLFSEAWEFVYCVSLVKQNFRCCPDFQGMNPFLNLAFLKDSFTLEVYACDPKEFRSKGHIYKASKSVLRLV